MGRTPRTIRVVDFRTVLGLLRAAQVAEVELRRQNRVGRRIPLRQRQREDRVRAGRPRVHGRRGLPLAALRLCEGLPGGSRAFPRRVEMRGAGKQDVVVAANHHAAGVVVLRHAVSPVANRNAEDDLVAMMGYIFIPQKDLVIILKRVDEVRLFYLINAIMK